MAERGCALAILDVGVGAGLDQSLDRLDVVLAAVAEHHRLDQRRPAEIVDMVERRLGLDQRAHDLDMAEMGGRDQRGAVVGAGDVLAPWRRPRARS